MVMPNPFYQIYEGAALLAGATPEFINIAAENDFRFDFVAAAASRRVAADAADLRLLARAIRPAT